MRDVLTFIHDNKDIVRSVITLNFTAKFILFYEQIYKAVQKQIEFDRQSGQFYVDVTIYGEFLTGGILSVITN